MADTRRSSLSFLALILLASLSLAVIALPGCSGPSDKGGAQASPTSSGAAPTQTAAPAASAATPAKASPTPAPQPPSPTSSAPTAVPTTTPAPVAPTETAAPAPPTATSVPPTPTQAPFVGSRKTVEVSHDTPAPFPLLTTVRAAKHDGFDRIVFEFKGAIPGYRVQYVKPPILADASGAPVSISGNAFLMVRFSTAAAHDDNGKVTCETRELKPGFPALVETRQVGDFEAVLSWALGLGKEADFAVHELQNPSRVVIDVAHP
jgi:hypothetical protein